MLLFNWNSRTFHKIQLFNGCSDPGNFLVLGFPFFLVSILVAFLLSLGLFCWPIYIKAFMKLFVGNFENLIKFEKFSFFLYGYLYLNLNITLDTNMEKVISELYLNHLHPH